MSFLRNLRRKSVTNPCQKTKHKPPSKNVLADRPHKLPVSIRLSPEVLEYFRATGKGWQTRVDEVLKEWMRKHRQRGF